jgi:hypothetical protein
MPQSYLKINSADRLNSTTTTPAQFSIACNRPLTGLRLKSIYLPITLYTVSALNNTVYFTDTQPRVATIASGYYNNATTFMTNLAAAMNAASGGAGIYTCTQNALTLLLTVTCTVPFSMTFSQTTASAAEMMGFSNANSAAAALSQTGTAIMNLSTTLCYNVSINRATGTTSLTGASTSFVIPALSTTPSEQYYEVLLNMPQSITFSSTNVLDIAIYDDSHRLMNMQSNWYMMCEAIDTF